MAYASQEIPVNGVPTLKEIDGGMQYILTFSQDPFPRLLEQKQSDRSNTLRSTRSDRPRSSLEQRRGTAGHGRYKFKDEDDKNIINGERNENRRMRLRRRSGELRKGRFKCAIAPS